MGTCFVSLKSQRLKGNPDMALLIEPVTSERLADLANLFATDEVANRCWCMWFIIPVKDFHKAGAKGNQAHFRELAARSGRPMGLIAYQDGEPVGWVATGPRSRYVRALKTPTFRGGDTDEDSSTWLVPCFFVRETARGIKLTETMLQAALQYAEENGATAMEGFPFSGDGRRRSGDIQVGFQSVFEACGFEVVRAPSTNRVVMRRELHR